MSPRHDTECWSQLRLVGRCRSRLELSRSRSPMKYDPTALIITIKAGNGVHITPFIQK